MTRNHRIIATRVEKTKEFYFQIHEVCYDDKDKPYAHTAEPATACGNTLREIEVSLKRMREAAQQPFLIYNGNTYTERGM